MRPPRDRNTTGLFIPDLTMKYNRLGTKVHLISCSTLRQSGLDMGPRTPSSDHLTGDMVFIKVPMEYARIRHAWKINAVKQGYSLKVKPTHMLLELALA